jgi:hypothetical protein
MGQHQLHDLIRRGISIVLRTDLGQRRSLHEALLKIFFLIPSW